MNIRDTDITMKNKMVVNVSLTNLKEYNPFDLWTFNGNCQWGHGPGTRSRLTRKYSTREGDMSW